MTSLIEARHLSFSRRGRALVDDVSLTIEAGTLAAIVGPNGAGKSTLVRLLCGELKPSAGEVRVDGQPIAAAPAWRLACRRAVMPQASGLAFPFTVRAVAALGVEGVGRGLSGRERAGLVADALHRADVVHLAERLYQTLSGGERQRVHFARVLAQLAAGRTVEARQVLFLDEPVAGLDLKHQLALLAEARRLTGTGVTVVAVLHDLQLAATAADTAAVLAEGRLVGHGAPDRVLTRALVEDVFQVRIEANVVPPSLWRLAVGAPVRDARCRA